MKSSLALAQSYHECFQALRTPDLSKFRSDSKASRYVIYSVPTQLYWVDGATNMTLQAMNRATVNDIQKMVHDGLETENGVSQPHFRTLPASRMFFQV